MPNKDGTGPQGDGQPGKGDGPCQKDPNEGYQKGGNQPSQPQPKPYGDGSGSGNGSGNGSGRGRGRGRGRSGCGRGNNCDYSGLVVQNRRVELRLGRLEKKVNELDV